MNLETPSANRDTENEHKQETLKLDQAVLKGWLTTEVKLTVPRWAILAASLAIFMLLLIALD